MNNSNHQTEHYNVSIILPFYNAGKTIEKTLEALINQTLSSIEIICINDGSTDDSPGKVERLARTTQIPIRLINQNNQGSYAARSNGIKQAKGDYIGFCDADDIAEPEMFESLYNKIIECNADMAICPYYRQENEKVLSTEMKYNFPGVISVDENAGWLVSVNTATWNKLIRADLVKVHATLTSSPRIGEDALFLLSIYPHIKSVTFVDKPLYHYYINNSSAMKAITEKEVSYIVKSWKQTRIQISSNYFLYIFDLAAFVHLGISLPLVLFKSNHKNAEAIYSTLLKVLDSSFPKYKQNPFLKVRYVLTHRKFMTLPYFAYIFAKLKLLAPLLKIYNLLTSFFKKDIKW